MNKSLTQAEYPEPSRDGDSDYSEFSGEEMGTNREAAIQKASTHEISAVCSISSMIESSPSLDYLSA